MVSVARRIGFYAAFIIPGLVVAGFYFGGMWNYLALLFAFVILPVLDQLIGTDPSNVPENEVERVEREYYYRFVIYLWTYLQLAMIVWGAYAVTTNRLSNVWEWIGFIVSFSLITGGIGITVAHELGHKKSPLERLYARLLLMTVCYMHFTIEHNRGHHVSVATPEDPGNSAPRSKLLFILAQVCFPGLYPRLETREGEIEQEGAFTFQYKKRNALVRGTSNFTLCLADACVQQERGVLAGATFLFLAKCFCIYAS